MTAAYQYADGGHVSPEINLAHQVDRLGVMAVFGRPVLYASEYYAMKAAEMIVAAYRSRARADNVAAWHNEHPELAQMLFEAEKNG